MDLGWLLLAATFPVVMKPIKRQKQDLENERDADFAPPSFYFSNSSGKSNSTYPVAKVVHTPVTDSSQLVLDHPPTESQDITPTSCSSLGTDISQAQTVASSIQSQPGTFPVGSAPSFFPPPYMQNYAYLPAQQAFYPPNFLPPPFIYPSYPPPAPPPPPPGVGP